MGISQRQLARDFQGLGVRPGTRLIAHTALSQVGYVDGGAAALLDALKEDVSVDGLLVVPAFTYDRRPFEFASERVTGAVSTAAVRDESFHRSFHPTHSFSLWGREAAALAERHAEHDAIGPTSALFHLYENSGFVLLIGVDHRADTSIHLAEYLARVSYGRSSMATVKTSHGFRKVEITWRPGCSEGFQRVQQVAAAVEGYRTGTVGRAVAQLIPIRPLVDVVAERLRTEPTWLLGQCAWCREARRHSGPR